MAQDKRVVILGGHGKVAMLAAPKLVSAGWSVDSLIRNPDHRDDVAATGATPVVLDIENADVDQLAEAFDGADAVVFSAGAGGGNPARTRAVDLEAAVRSMEAAEQAGVTRYVMVSYVRAETDVDTLDKESSFYPYAEAKHHADSHLRGTALDWTILGPGSLTQQPATRRLQVVDAGGLIDGRRPDAAEVGASRENVAEAITHVLTAGAAVRRTVNFYDGETPLEEALA
ncbi:SDR family oxidoreductase [Nesterenkonia sp. PF2B19]|uniref:SDR family oxidoreductase n=1 Tax=Nesterenkonia sp. PF2B19 TaxID=1881858 RepID=UPI000A19E6E3|nr:SDR family oxidoreductase [Nesterenkonia sp. PF2B19]OSM42544.1 NAD-dependent dehydratase [Nesterenkonia sp. PF2B19]